MRNIVEENKWINYFQGFMRGIITASVAHSVESSIKDGSMSMADGEAFLDISISCLNTVMEDLIRKTPDRVNRQLSREEEKALVKEVGGRTSELAKAMIEAQRRTSN